MFEITRLNLLFLATDHNGNPDLVQLESIIHDKVNTLVTLMHANNEIGTLLPLNKVANI